MSLRSFEISFLRFLGIHVCRMAMRYGKSGFQPLICKNVVSVGEKHDLPTQLAVCCFFVAFFSNSDTESQYVIRFEQTKRHQLVTYLLSTRNAASLVVLRLPGAEKS